MQGTNAFLEISHVSKNFGPVHALQDVSISVHKGEIHTLLGENGAGKSTLIKILNGELSPDSGSVSINGEMIKDFHPLTARKLGVSVVHQELALFDNIQVYENMFPYGNFRKHKIFIDKKEMIRHTQQSLDRFNIKVSPIDKLEDLRLSAQQMIEIMRAMNENIHIILLDEPTSGLETQETNALIQNLRKMRDEGITIVYISHRIKEVLDISDRITILRDGKYICTYNNDESLTELKLINSMVGRDFSKDIYVRKGTILTEAPVVFEVVDLECQGVSKPISFSVKRGEVLGIFGLEGSGTNEISRTIFGLDSFVKGTIRYNGETIVKPTPEKMIKRKIVYLSGNRKNMGLIFNMSIEENMILPVLDNISKLSVISNEQAKKHTERFVKKFRIVLEGFKKKPNSLSGGNQQKVMLATCLGVQPDCIIINEPTRGIDVGSKNEIIRFILEMANNGMTVLCFNSDLVELIKISDRVLVIYSNEIAGEVRGGDMTEENIMALAAMGRQEKRQNEK
jgi:ABC-type sugar transport system ATPase subunit